MYKEICKEVLGERTDYFLHWHHHKPLVITSERQRELVRMHRCLLACLHHIGTHYRDFLHVLPLSEKELEILDYQSRYPYRLGAYRPDYLISKDGELRYVEITSRFFGHGIWFSYYSEMAVERFLVDFPDEEHTCQLEQLWAYMAGMVPDGMPIYVFESDDKPVEAPLYSAFYSCLGHKVIRLQADEVEANINKWRNAFVISALNQNDIESYSMTTIKAMIDARMVNDFRTILLAHDKRFFALIFDNDFCRACLTPEDTTYLREHTIETYIYGTHQDKWDDARVNKNDYILKHCRLGKSVSVWAGCMTTKEDWQALFEREDVNEMILQPMLEQRTYPLTWEGTDYDEYICCCMLTVDEDYYGNGMVRTSSAPVTNKVDDRKMGVVETDSRVMINNGVVL